MEEATRRLRDLEAELEARLDGIRSAHALDAVELENVPVPPRKGDISVRRLALAWAPWRRTAGNGWEPDWDIGGSEPPG